MKFKSFYGLLLAFIIGASQAAPLTEDTVRVTGTRISGSVPIAVTVITSDDLRTAPVTTVAEALALATGVDVQKRGMPGAQADVTMRGGMFEQVLVLVDGVRMNSAQTGHLHADVPVAFGMVDRIEVLPGQASSVYGADAANGVVNIITKKDGDGFTAQLGYGEYGTMDAGVSLGMESGGMRHTVCFERAESDGYRYDTDYANTYVNVNSRAAYADGVLEATVLYGDRCFGAFDFYTPGSGYPSKEWTRTGGVILKNRHLSGSTVFESFLGVRRQYDRFVLFENDPLVYQNEHTVRYLEAESFAARPVGRRTRAVVGLHAGINHMTSTSLADRHGQRQALFGEIRRALAGNASTAAGIRIDRTDGTVDVAPSFSIACPGERFGWFARADMASRTPSYTERYYTDGRSNFGNADLNNERTAGAEAGGSYAFGNGITGKASMYVTRYEDYIDWAGTTVSGPWYASNMGRMLVYGIEPEVVIANRYVRAALSTSLLHRELDEDYISKYAFRYPVAAVTFTGSVPLAAERAELGVVTSYRKRTGEQWYLLADIRVRTELAYGMSLRCDVKNVFDAEYEDIPGVPQPGRMVSAGIEYRR